MSIPATTTIGDVCRLVVVGPTSQVELAVPVHIALADLIPTLLDHLDVALTAEGGGQGETAQDGWVLQRLGEPPLNVELGTAALGLRDGDLLCLRPSDDQLPPVGFADLIDGKAVGKGDQTGRWRPEFTRRLILAVVLPVLGVGLLSLILPGPAAGRGEVASLTALLLLIGTLVAPRYRSDWGATVLAGIGALAYAWLAGLLFPAAVTARAADGDASVLAASALGTLVALALAATARLARPVFTAAAMAGGLIGLGALIAVVMPESGVAGGAATALTLALAVVPFIPQIACRSVGMRLPALPMTAQEFQEDLEPEPVREVLDRTAGTDRMMDALSGGAGAVCVTSFTALLLSHSWYGSALVGVASLLLLLHSRVLRSARQRFGLTLPGLYGLLGLAVLGLELGDAVVRLAAPPACVLVAALLIAAAIGLPRRRPAPHWGRAAEILHTALATGVIPLAVGVLGGYEYLRGLGG